MSNVLKLPEDLDRKLTLISIALIRHKKISELYWCPFRSNFDISHQQTNKQNCTSSVQHIKLK